MEIRQILDGVESLEMVMPEFQREYVWPIEDAKQLLVSMFKGYPTGCLLFWETEDPPAIKNKAVDINKLGLTKVILDGQQRLTTLYMLIKGDIPPYYTQEDILNDPRHLYFNVLTGDFQFYQKSIMESNPLWSSVIKSFDENEVDSFDIAESYCEQNEVANFKDISKTIGKNLTVLRSIPKMIYPILTVPKSADINGAIDVFDRVNSRGTKLTDAELVLTHITGAWPQARRVLKKKMSEMKAKGFDFNLDLLTRCMVITLTKSALYKKNAKLKYSVFTEDDYKSAWNKVSKAFDYLIPILMQEGLISSTNDLSTNNALVPIVAYLVENDNRFTGNLKYQFLYWMFLALIWSRYSGQTDARLDKDIYIINNEEDIIKGLVQEIQDSRGRLEVKESDMEGRTAGHPLYKILYIITKANKAVDWSNGGAIYGTIGDYYSIQSHHIFPQAFLYKNGYDGQNHLDKKKVNEIANRAFITRDTNYSISAKAPIDYLPVVRETYPKALEKQFIPEDPKLWLPENFDEFLLQRRTWIANEINKFLKSFKEHQGDTEEEIVKPLKSWETFLQKGEDNFTEFKSSLRYCLRQHKPMDYIEHSILKTLNAFLNSEGGTLLIGVDDDSNILGLKNDYNSFSKKNKDGFLLHFDNMIINALGKEQQADIDIKIEALEGKDFAVVEVSSSNKPIFLNYKGKTEFWVRHAASSQSYDLSEAYEYINKHWN
jgi:hypothetical protein